MPKKDKALEVVNLCKVYKNGKVALESLSLEVDRGDFFALLGPNGAGKSTLINTISSTVIKTSGKIYICGIDTDESYGQAKMHLGVVPQEPVLDPFFTVFETLKMYAQYYNVPNSGQRALELIDLMQLQDKANVTSHSLSGGMKRRMLVAKALVHKPDVVILDEPTAGVDVDLRRRLWSYFVELNKQGTTVILTTHYLEEAQELCNNIAIINNGKIVLNGTKKEILENHSQKTLTVETNNIDNINHVKIDSILKAFNGKRCDKTLYFPAVKDVNETIKSILDAEIECININSGYAKLEDVFAKIVKQTPAP